MLNDYKGLKLIASSNPHIRNNEDTRSIMLDVIIALCPALIMSVIRFGFRALIMCLSRWRPPCSSSGFTASSCTSRR